jgi:hypothetical protein
MTKQIEEQPIIHRLMRRVEETKDIVDIAGYWKFDGDVWFSYPDNPDKWIPLYGHSPYLYTDFCRIDRWTGLKYPDGRLVFERDRALLNGHVLGDSVVTIIYKAPAFKVKHKDGTCYELNEYTYNFLGIEGVV